MFQSPRSSAVYRISHFHMSHLESSEPMRLPLRRSRPFPRVSFANVNERLHMRGAVAAFEAAAVALLEISFLFVPPADGTCLRRAFSDCSRFNLSTREPPEKTWGAKPLVFHGVIVAERLMPRAANFRSCSPHMLPTLRCFPEDEQRIAFQLLSCYR